jgi:hypothetical protein
VETSRCRRFGSSRLTIALATILSFAPIAHIGIAHAQTAPKPMPKQPVIIDTDIGDGIDDAFALALAERSPEFRILGVTTAFGETTLRSPGAPSVNACLKSDPDTFFRFYLSRTTAR